MGNKKFLNCTCVMVMVLVSLFTFVPTFAKAPPLDSLVDESETDIQNAVESYFRWQYAAQKNGIAMVQNMQPMASSADAQFFLRSKQDQLEVMEYSNQLYGIKIMDQSFSLKFLKIALDEKANLATVEVDESYKRMYEGASRPALAQNIVHRLILRLNNETWEIISDAVVNATDVPPMVVDKSKLMDEIRQEAEARRQFEQEAKLAAGITPEFLSQQRAKLAKENWTAQEIEKKLVAMVDEIMNQALDQPSQELESGSFLPTRNNNRSYDRGRAEAYIHRWWNGRNTAVWGDYGPNGGDCTNYVSQIMRAGGIPEDKSGSYLWYWDNANPPSTPPPYSRSSSWTGVIALWDYIQGNTNGNGPNGPQGEWWTSGSGRTSMQTGDVIQLWKGNPGECRCWGHSYAVHSARWSNGQYKVYVTSHDSDRYEDDLDVAASLYPNRRYIHVLGWYNSNGGHRRLIAGHNGTNGRSLDVEAISQDNGAHVQQWDWVNGNNQKWDLVTAYDGYYMLVAKHSGKCLDVAGGSTSNGAAVVQYDCHDGTNQHWKLESVGSYYKIVSRKSGKCLDVKDWSTANGAHMQQWDCPGSGGKNQQWNLITVQ